MGTTAVTETESVRIEMLKGLWVARPPEFRKAENVADFHEFISRYYSYLLGGEESHYGCRKALEGLILES
jgi:hypothetical protein